MGPFGDLHLQERLRAAATTGVTAAAAGGLALIGMVWVSIAAVGALSRMVDPAAAQAIVGLALIAPLVIVAVRQRKAKPAPAPAAAYATSQGAEDLQTASMLRITQLMDEHGAQSPLLSTGVALIAGILAVRMPSVLPIFVQVLTQALRPRSTTAPPPPAPPAAS